MVEPCKIGEGGCTRIGIGGEPVHLGSGIEAQWLLDGLPEHDPEA
jgi:hypothetical protein